jgi:hypothetical protein
MRPTTIVASILVITCALGSGAGAAATVVLRGNGLTIARLGAGETTALAALSRALGAPTSPVTAAPELSNCGVDAIASWHALSAYFDHERLVGLSLGPGARPAGETAAGLRVGDTLARARSLYPGRLRTSTNQGGAWFARTPSGSLDGFLAPSDGKPGPRSRILTIDVGVVGCPAMSP